AQETILPACFSRAQRLWREKIHPEWEWDRYEDVMIVTGPGLFLTAQTFFVKDGRMVWPVLDYYREGRIAKEIVATEADWDDTQSRWVCHDAVERTFSAVDGGAQEKSYDRLVSEMQNPPKTMIPRNTDPDAMSLAETLKYLRQVRALGGSSREAWTAFYAK